MNIRSLLIVRLLYFRTASAYIVLPMLKSICLNWVHVSAGITGRTAQANLQPFPVGIIRIRILPIRMIGITTS